MVSADPSTVFLDKLLFRTAGWEITPTPVPEALGCVVELSSFLGILQEAGSQNLESISRAGSVLTLEAGRPSFISQHLC